MSCQHAASVAADPGSGILARGRAVTHSCGARTPGRLARRRTRTEPWPELRQVEIEHALLRLGAWLRVRSTCDLAGRVLRSIVARQSSTT